MAGAETRVSKHKDEGFIHFFLEMVAATVAVFSGMVLLWSIFHPGLPLFTMPLAGLLFTVALVALVRLIMDPDSVRAHQTDEMLQMASSLINSTAEGMNYQSAQKICEMLLANTSSIAVALTNRDFLLGYAGYQSEQNPPGNPVRTRATIQALSEGEMLVLHTPQEIGLSEELRGDLIHAAIIVPLHVANKVEGVLKFYYDDARKITETQQSIANGFAHLICTQMAALDAEEQRKLATKMELKMLQFQINPHFLFNTINTISSFIRTDPAKARTLLREFAVFYRRTLEDSNERILLSRELDQVERYFHFELARFGEERLGLEIHAGEDLANMMVPPFLVQPLVENAIKHAMPSEGKLTITIDARVEGDDVVLTVADDGVGMSNEACENIMHTESSTGLGIAVKNVHDRMIGFYGPDACMDYESELGVGTKVTLVFPDCAKDAAEGVVTEAPASQEGISAEAAAAAAVQPGENPGGLAADGVTQSAETMNELTELMSQVKQPDKKW